MYQTATIVLACFAASITIPFMFVKDDGHGRKNLSYINPKFDVRTVPVEQRLADHSQEFEKDIIKVTDGVYVAVGFAIANTILLEGSDGLVVVDTTESIVAAEEIMEGFRKITDKPVKGIIYTHNHADHVSGTEAFIEDASNPPEIWAHHLLLGQVSRWVRLAPRWMWGAIHQFGHVLPEGAVPNVGIGPGVDVRGKARMTIPPTHLMYQERETVTLAGIELTLIHVPGETPDQIAVWWPEKRVLLPADDVYKAFPNLYAVRGTPPRNILDWATSVGKMRRLNAEHLVPSHTKPLSGQSDIHELLSSYMYAIRYVHDQSVRYINKGVPVDQLPGFVKLPPSLEHNPHLLEFYGRVEFAVRAVYDMYFGWFDTDVATMLPLTKQDRAEKMVKLIGAERLEDAIEEAHDNGECQWVLEMTSMLKLSDGLNERIKSVRLSCLGHLASEQISSGARNFYITTAALESGELKLTPTSFANLFWGDDLTIDEIFDILKCRVKAELFQEDLKLAVQFKALNCTYLLSVEHSVLDVERVAIDTETEGTTTIETDLLTWKTLLARHDTLNAAIEKKTMVVTGHLSDVTLLLSLLD